MLCTFHVLKYLKKKVSDLDIRKNLKSDIMKAISSLVYSYSEEIYRERLTELLKLSPKSFSSYFTDNWDSCREMWAHCYRKSLPTLGNNTNNRVESHNQKLKAYLGRSCHLSDSVDRLINFCSHTAQNVKYLSFNMMKTRIDTRWDCDIQSVVSRICTAPAVDLIMKQFEKLHNGSYDVNSYMEGEKAMANVQVGEKVYKVSDMLKCSCSFHCMYQLPCHHIFACRKKNNIDLFVSDLVPMRWKKNFADSDVPAAASSVVVKTESQPTGPLTERQKYNVASEITKDLTSFLATCGQKEFFEKLRDLKFLMYAWQANKLVHIEVDGSRSSKAADLVNQVDSSSENNSSTCERDDDVSQMNSPPPNPIVESGDISDVDKSGDVSERLPEVNINDDINSTTMNASISPMKQIRDKLFIAPVKHRRGRPKGSTKPFWSFSGQASGAKKRKCNTSLVSKNKKGKPKEKPDDKGEYRRERKEESDKGESNKMIEDFSLSTDNLETISNGDQLDDAVIHAAQKLLAKQFPKIAGFQSTLFAQNVSFFQQVPGEMVQILYSPGHWVTVSTIGCETDTVNYYDSLNHTIPESVLRQTTRRETENGAM
ncbi:uncharacterized protein [Ptychodera flava]|uniref:uncharacterized protein isoform X2 n=1 Tax=Ptychodera flava TaxID=63121 RepID=UPI00396A90BD